MMKAKEYALNSIPQILKIDTEQLDKILAQNSQSFKIIKKDDQQYIDQQSFNKLLFIKQLNSKQPLSQDQVLELINSPVESFKVNESTSVVSRLSKLLQATTNEAYRLKSQVKKLVVKHDKALDELEKSRCNNIRLRKEISTLHNRQAALMGQLRQSAESEFEAGTKVIN